MRVVTASVGVITVVCADHDDGLWSAASRHFEGQSDFLLVHCPPQHSDLLSLCNRLRPCVLLASPPVLVHLPPTDLRHLCASGNVHALIVGGPGDSPEHFLRLGCMGLLRMDAPAPMYRKAVQTVATGELWAPRNVLSRLARQALTAGDERTLTKREAEILNLISRGYTNRDIAAELFISRETVRWHVRGIYSKLGVTNRQGAMNVSSKLLAASTKPTTV